MFLFKIKLNLRFQTIICRNEIIISDTKKNFNIYKRLNFKIKFVLKLKFSNNIEF